MLPQNKRTVRERLSSVRQNLTEATKLLRSFNQLCKTIVISISLVTSASLFALNYYEKIVQLLA
ncbi:hypothetical protein [Novispirillum itersonii]|uniref:hypothetical protein n=1 Tax=Novispirillum itersonii TaxID=189 RepID=UPI00037AB62D|nr:hypothetical protein [Novispirillum itersonii]